MAQIITSAGPDPVAITTESVGKTIAGAKIMGQGNDLVLDTSSFYRPTQPGSYPIVLATYEIVCSKYPDATTGTAVRAFMQAAIVRPRRPGPIRLHSVAQIVPSKIGGRGECYFLT